MIKFVIICSKIIIATIISILFVACNANVNFGQSIKGSGHVTKEVRQLNGFDKVTVAQGLDCEIHQSDKFAVIVEADDNVHDAILTTVENGTLVIKSKYNNYKNVSSKKVIVQMPKISSLESSSGSSLKTPKVITGTSIALKSSSGSEMNTIVESDTVTCESTSGSELIVKGKALKVYTASSSGSEIEAGNLKANNIDAQSTSGSTTKIHPIVLLNAKASSGSSIEYTNIPKQIKKQSNSGGSISNE